MTPSAYLLYSIQQNCYRRMAWIVSAFAVTSSSDKDTDEFYPGKIVREPFAIFFLNESKERVKIDVADVSQPLFRKEDRIDITPEWISSLTTPTLNTSVGTLLVNLAAIYSAFGKKFPYKAGRFSVRDVEADVAPKLRSTPPQDEVRDDNFFYVDEYLRFHSGKSLLESLSHLFSHSVTRIGLLPAPGRKAFKAELLKKYEGKLNDPVHLGAFEKELQGYETAYLKTDPAYGKYMAGKVSKSRMKSFMTQGGETNDFTGSLDVTPIIQSLDEGIPLDKKGFVAISNTIRYGSYSRGVETINGGVTSKAIGVATENWRITEGDCGATKGVFRVYSKDDIFQLVGRYVIQSGKSVLVEDAAAAEPYIGKALFVRSPGYCRRSRGDEQC